MKKISIIVAIASNWAIGKNNQLLWHIPADMKWFKKTTTGHQVIMGKLTYLSLPFRPLPNRTNIVITDNRAEHFEGCITVYSIEAALDLCTPDDESFIIGGGSVYRQFLPYANRLYLTKVNKDFEADTFFNPMEGYDWKLIEQTDFPADDVNDFSYSFQVYEK